MIGIEYVIAFAMALVNVIKKRIPATWSDIIPFIGLALAILLNVVNAMLFGGVVLDAAKDAFIAGGVALALFSGGSAVGKNLLPKKDTSQ